MYIASTATLTEATKTNQPHSNTTRNMVYYIGEAVEHSYLNRRLENKQFFPFSWKIGQMIEGKLVSSDSVQMDAHAHQSYQIIVWVSQQLLPLPMTPWAIAQMAHLIKTLKKTVTLVDAENVTLRYLQLYQKFSVSMLLWVAMLSWSDYQSYYKYFHMVYSQKASRLDFKLAPDVLWRPPAQECRFTHEVCCRRLYVICSRAQSVVHSGKNSGFALRPSEI